MSLKEKLTIVSLLSGGLDSATATALAIERGYDVIALSIDYGQRHIKELTSAISLGEILNIKEHKIICIDLTKWGGSSLTDKNTKIQTVGLSNDIPNTYVPGRNTIFIAMGLSLAEAKNAKKLVLGVNAIDYSGYPDCRPEYLDAYQKLANLSSKSGVSGNIIELWAPLIKMNKIEIVKEALRLKIPIEKTWSCYEGLDEPCGICDSCRIRNKALSEVKYSKNI
tara:strand:- start:2436 stop:3107 length:672 start_codon:yes stop_codon:yes gene_type:complete